MKPMPANENAASELLIASEEILTLASNEWKHMLWYLDRDKADSSSKESQPPSDWISFRQKYEKWYRSCIGLMKANQFSGVDDFISLYRDNQSESVTIKSALLIGFSIENWTGFSDRLDNQIAILQSFEHEFEHSTDHLRVLSTYLHQYPYVDLERLKELSSISSVQFNLLKLVRLCEELNICYQNDCFLATAILVRSIVDHVPPIFGCKSFTEVSSNYSNGSKSFKQAMEHLNNSSRKIADTFLHGQARRKEVLPNKTQINFSNDLDVLLAEIVRILK